MKSSLDIFRLLTPESIKRCCQECKKIEMMGTLLECNFNSHLSIGYHEFTRLFSTFSYNTDYENPGVVLPVSK